jgi:hypothetical protein
MDASRFIGKRSFTIWLSIGPKPWSSAELRVTATVLQDIVCNPGDVEFGSVASGETPSQTIDIEYAGPLAWKVSDVVVPKNAPFEATVKELYRRQDRVGYQVKVSLSKDAAPGEFHENILLKTNHPDAGLLPILVNGNIEKANKPRE